MLSQLHLIVMAYAIKWVLGPIPREKTRQSVQLFIRTGKVQFRSYYLLSLKRKNTLA